jgi:hypothetical protein
MAVLVAALMANGRCASVLGSCVNVCLTVFLFFITHPESAAIEAKQSNFL